MRSIIELMKTGWPMLLSGIVVVLVLQGCTTPLVDVKVSTGEGCGGSTTDGDDGKGACYVYPSGSTPYTGPAYGFLQTTDQLAYKGTGNCGGGKKCASSSGRCANGKPCIPWVTPSDMSCKCACAP